MAKIFTKSSMQKKFEGKLLCFENSPVENFKILLLKVCLILFDTLIVIHCRAIGPWSFGWSVCGTALNLILSIHRRVCGAEGCV